STRHPGRPVGWPAGAPSSRRRPVPHRQGFDSFGSPVVVRTGVVVPATVTSEFRSQGLFLLRRGRARVIVPPDARVPGSAGMHFSDFGAMRRAESGVVFLATLDVSGEVGLFSWRPRSGLRRLDARGDGPPLTLLGPVATRGRTIVAVGFEEDDGIFLLGKR